MSVLPHAIALAKRNFSVVPIDPMTKFVPKGFGKWGDLQKNAMNEERLREVYSQNPTWRMGLVCGAISGFLEVIDFDEPGIYDQWRNLLDQNGYEELTARLVVERTPRGGAHVFYRCPEKVDGNQKLARRPATADELIIKPKERYKGLIETRGEGGLIVCAPSKGYEPCQHDLSKVPFLSPDERDALLHAARTFETVFEDRPNREPQGGDPTGKPGWDFNHRSSWRPTLEKHGWTYVTTIGPRDYWRRPDKQEGWSATTGNGETDLLYVFSTSCYPLESEHTYSKFAFVALMEYGGDFGACASALYHQGYGERYSAANAAPVEAGPPVEEGKKRWSPTKYSDLCKRPKKPMLLDGLLGEGDNAMIFGLPKSGKTFVVIDLLLSAVCGGTFAGVFDVARPLTVAYFTNEGLGSLHQRLMACQSFNAVPYEDIETRLLVFEDVPQLYAQEGAETIRSFADEWATERPIDLVVIDTLNKATLGSDENSNSDAALVASSLRYCRRKLGCATLLIHHSDKAGEKVRGASAYDGDLDVQLKVAKDMGVRFMELVFAKDLSGFEPRAFRLMEVNESAAVAWTGTPEVAQKVEAVVQIELFMRSHPEKEWWTLSQIHDLLPHIKRDTIRKACANEVTNKATEYALLDAMIDAEGNRLATYRSRYLAGFKEENR